MVLELFDDRAVLISDAKTGRQFNVNGHRLKPYLTSEPPAPAYKVNLHLPEHSRTWRYHPRPIISRRFYFCLVWLKTLNLALLGGTPRLSYLFSFMCFFSFYRYRRTTLGKGAPAQKSHEHHGKMSLSKPLSPHFYCFHTIIWWVFTWACSFHWGQWNIPVGGEDLEKALPFSKILKFYLLKTPIFQNFDLI